MFVNAKKAAYISVCANLKSQQILRRQSGVKKLLKNRPGAHHTQPDEFSGHKNPQDGTYFQYIYFLF